MEECLKQKTDDALVYYNLAGIYHELGYVEKSISHLEKCVEIEPHDLNAVLLLAKRYRNQNQIPWALDLLKRLESYHSNRSEYWLNRGNLCFAQDDLQQAITAYQYVTSTAASCC